MAETRHLADRLVLRRVDPPGLRFLIFAQGRSGTTLLTDLLRSHPDVWCDDEMLNATLHMRYRDPVGRTELRSRIATRRGKRAYGFHVKIRQLAEQQGVDPAGYLGALERSQWQFIWLRRENVVRSALSNLVREQRGLAHVRSGSNGVPTDHELRFNINPERLVEHARNRRAMHAAERSALGDRHFIEVLYERDLLDSSRHQSTADRVFDELGLPSATVGTDLARTGRDELSDQIENFADVEAAISDAGLAHFLHAR